MRRAAACNPRPLNVPHARGLFLEGNRAVGSVVELPHAGALVALAARLPTHVARAPLRPGHAGIAAPGTRSLTRSGTTARVPASAHSPPKKAATPLLRQAATQSLRAAEGSVPFPRRPSSPHATASAEFPLVRPPPVPCAIPSSRLPGPFSRFAFGAALPRSSLLQLVPGLCVLRIAFFPLFFALSFTRPAKQNASHLSDSASGDHRRPKSSVFRHLRPTSPFKNHCFFAQLRPFLSTIEF